MADMIDLDSQYVDDSWNYLDDGIMFELILASEPSTGCGITIHGSPSSGIAVKSILAGTMAEMEGSIQIGDRIIAVDDRLTNSLTCGQVARLMRQSHFIKLCLYRPNYLPDMGESRISSPVASSSSISPLNSPLSLQDFEFEEKRSSPGKKLRSNWSKILKKRLTLIGRGKSMPNSSTSNISSDSNDGGKRGWYYQPAIFSLRRLFNKSPSQPELESTDHYHELKSSHSMSSMYTKLSTTSTTLTEPFDSNSFDGLLPNTPSQSSDQHLQNTTGV